MRNFEKYQTTEERTRAHIAFCRESNCIKCPARVANADCRFAWLELEDDVEKPLPCPFCGSECTATVMQNEWRVSCIVSGCYRSSFFGTEEEAVAAHNRVARVVMAAKKGGEGK